MSHEALADTNASEHRQDGVRCNLTYKACSFHWWFERFQESDSFRLSAYGLYLSICVIPWRGTTARPRCNEELVAWFLEDEDELIFDLK